jgi:hypothetical protein
MKVSKYEGERLFAIIQIIIVILEKTEYDESLLSTNTPLDSMMFFFELRIWSDADLCVALDG